MVDELDALERHVQRQTPELVRRADDAEPAVEAAAEDDPGPDDVVLGGDGVHRAPVAGGCKPCDQLGLAVE